MGRLFRTVVLVVLGGLFVFGAYRFFGVGQGVASDTTAETGPEATATESDSPPPSADAAELMTGTVIFVIDGDTVDMEIGGERERVRLLGIDAPESVHRSVPEQCFGAESSAALTELLPIGSEVTLERDVEARDRFGRLLLYLYRSDDGLFINEQLVRTGMADTSFYEPNTTLADTLTAARAEARAERAGLWGRCDGPDQPLD